MFGNENNMVLDIVIRGEELSSDCVNERRKRRNRTTGINLCVEAGLAVHSV